jgi:hypothetical protein
MSAATISTELAQLQERHEHAERWCEDAAGAERAAFVAWQEAYGAYQVACSEASTAWSAWVAALTP